MGTTTSKYEFWTSTPISFLTDDLASDYMMDSLAWNFPNCFYVTEIMEIDDLNSCVFSRFSFLISTSDTLETHQGTQRRDFSGGAAGLDQS